MLEATALVTGADLGTLFSAPVPFIAAPPAGSAVVVLEVLMRCVIADVGFTTSISPDLFYGTPPGANRATSSDWNFGPATSDKSTTGIASNGSAIDTEERDAQPVLLGAGSDVARAGPIVTASLADGGAGYAVGDTGEVDLDIYGGGAAYEIDTVDGGGAVLTFHLTSAGAGYSTVNNPLTTTAGGAQPGAGTGLTVNVDAIAAPDGTLFVQALYSVVELGP